MDIFSPRKVYCYQSLVASIETLLCRPGFADQCEYWRKRLSSDCSEEYLGDIYDGKVWKEFQHYEGKPFLAVPNNFALSLNLDWFSPFKHTEDNVGAIYIVIQNLPREVRYKVENVILCGVIPGPQEPQYTIASYLVPLEDELVLLWEGVKLCVPSLGCITV